MVKRLSSPLAERLKAVLILSWLGCVAALVVFFPATAAQWRDRLGDSLLVPVLLAAFFYGRIVGLASALFASLVLGGLALAQPDAMQFEISGRLLADILLLNVLALLTSALAEREKSVKLRYKGLFDGVPVGVYRTDANGLIHEVNPALVRMLGYESRDELVGTPARDLYADPEERDRLFADLEKHGQVHDYEILLKRRGGEPLRFLDTAIMVRSVSGEQDYTEGILVDVTETRKAREELDAANRLMVDIIEFLPDATFVVDQEKRIIAWNKATEEMTGVPKQDVLGRGDYAYSVPFFGERRPFLLDLIWEDSEIVSQGRGVRRKGGTLFNEEYVPTLHNGRGAFLWAAAAPLLDKEGKLLGAIEVVRDITDRKKAEHTLAELNRELEKLVDNRTRDLAEKARQLESANKRLLELDDMKSALLSTVSHDIRTPLTSVLGFAKIIQRDFEKYFAPLSETNPVLPRRSQRIQGNVAVIISEGERLTRLINDFLDLSKIEAGKMQWNDTQIHLPKVLSKAVNAVEGILHQNPGLTLATSIPEDLPPIACDPDRMEQVLVNLLTNAIKFTTKGEITLKAKAATHRISISVTDQGPGVPREEQSRIFERFHQVHHDTISTNSLGTGLGLAICQQIVEHYNGSILVDSPPGQGATFTVTLPIK